MERIESLNKQVKEDKVVVKRCKYPSTVSVLLNHQKRLNSLDTSMYYKLSQIAQSQNNNIVIMRGAGDKAFSCGGDVKTLYKFITQNDEESLFKYFTSEFEMDYSYYLLNQQSFCGQITIYNGIAIGGSLTMSIYSKIRICTEKTFISLPECKNGLVVPSIQFFSQIRDNLGIYLMLMGDFIKGEDCVKFGLADYYVEHKDLVDLQYELEQQEDIENCHKVCQKYALQVERNNIKNYQYIKDLFKVTDFNAFWKNLNEKAEQTNDLKLQKFAQYCVQQINLSSKIALLINYSLIQQCLDISYNPDQFMLSQATAAINMTKFSQDCIEGLKRAVIDKFYVPQWQHESPLSVSQSEIDQILKDTSKVQMFVEWMSQSFAKSKQIFSEKETYYNSQKITI